MFFAKKVIDVESWVRRDGHSLSFHAGEPPTCLMWLHWACVVFLQLAFRS